MNSFISRLRQANRERGFLVQGLDPVEEKIPSCVSEKFRFNPVLLLTNFLLPVIDATAPHVAGFKPNLSFFLMFDDIKNYKFHGQETLAMICQYLRWNYPDHLIILDAKDGDIGTSNDGYCQRAFDGYEADAVTWDPYLGTAISQQLAHYPQKGFIALARTSNQEGTQVQNATLDDNRSVYEHIVETWLESQTSRLQIGFVAGATHPDELRKIRKQVGAAALLIPGVGTQGGSASEVAVAGFGGRYGNMMINVSSGSLYASNGDLFAEAAGAYMQNAAAVIKTTLSS